MDTSVISYRVADFLKQHPPFQAMSEGDLLELAGRGRVRFHEANEYILWQGEPHKLHVFVIQQGTVSLWDETDERVALRDVRGAGDMLGIERFTGAPCCLYSARSATDVVIYAFPVAEFDALVLTSPYARHFIEAHATVTADYQPTKDARDPQQMPVRDLIAGREVLARCTPATSIREAAALLRNTGRSALAVVEGDKPVHSLVTVDSVLAWVAAGAGAAEQPISGLARPAPPTVAATASVVEGVLAIAEADAEALAVTADGAPGGRLQALVTVPDLARAFGDQPISVLREAPLAATTQDLRELNHRVRALALQHLTSAGSLDWLARFISLADVRIVERIIALVGADIPAACWCFCGASGRGESLTAHAPGLVLIVDDPSERPGVMSAYERVADGLLECGYVARVETPFDRRFHAASSAEWQSRFEHWMDDPVRTQMYLARPLFDLRPVHGRRSLWQDVEATVVRGVSREFVYLLANDCLASLPPLTFFQDAVIDEAGGHTAVFRLEHSALRPLVDVGRVFGMAARNVLGTSTGERFGRARTLLPGHESIFHDASETLRILLWQQARIGIAQGTDGSELPPALLSRQDRHVLKGGFRSIRRLLELTGDPAWLSAI